MARIHSPPQETIDRIVQALKHLFKEFIKNSKHFIMSAHHHDR